METCIVRNLNVKRNKLGFTLAELLIVIAILVILIGLGVPGFLTLRRNIKIAEYDDIAREIYVAAQNQLTRLAANGLDDGAQTDLEEASLVSAQPGDYTGNWEQDKADYHHANKNDVAMEWLLPLGAVSDDLRTNGYYVIEYNARTYTVYSVFYAQKGFDYGTVAGTANFRTSRDVRKGPMVGYYGGSAVNRDEQPTCPTPQLRIINNNILQLDILHYPTDGTKVEIMISDGENTQIVPGTSMSPGIGGLASVLLDSMESSKRFRDVFPGLTPGNDLTITVTYTKETATSGTATSSASITANSLFATRQTEGDTDVVTIAWARHLQNLQPTVSQLNDPQITIARQTDHIEWEPEFAPFVSIENTHLKRYEGGNLEIRDLRGSNGLFASADNKELSGICVVNPTVTADIDTPVGALAATANNAKITGCGVYYRKIKDDSTIDYAAYSGCGVTNTGASVTGGLVGSASGAVITNSFAALPVIKAQNGASLIGSATDCTIQNSYANCDTLPTKNFNYFLDGTGNTVEHCYAVGNVENDKPGLFVPDGNTVSDSYYAVSHSKWEGNKKTDLWVTECYYRDNAAADWQETNCEGLAKNSLTGWDKMIAPLTHPYREYLDRRAYPYPAIGALDHYGSWPESDGTVKLKITMRMLNQTEYAFFAGRVIVTNEDKLDASGNPTVLFDSKDHVKNNVFDGKDTVDVIPGTNIKIKVTENDGYEYLLTDILGVTYTQKEIPYTVKKDTEAVVTFRQSTFTLTCAWPEDENGTTIQQKTYAADCANLLTILPPDKGDVEIDSSVTVRITSTPDAYAKGGEVVWYVLDDDQTKEKHYVQKGVDGNYVFQMPGGNATLHVMHPKNTVHFQVKYNLMDAESGEYKQQGVSNIEYGIGTVIDQQLMRVLADSSNLTLTLEDQNVLYLAKATAKKSGNEGYVFHSTSDDQGEVTYPEGQDRYVTSQDQDRNDNFFIEIYIARKEYTLILEKGDNIDQVSFGADGGKTEGEQTTIEKKFRYGQKVEAWAEVMPGQVFTAWESSDSRFRMSSAPHYAFTMPYYDLKLKASATRGLYLVTLNLLENDESWLASSASRQADPISVYLVNSKDETIYYKMDCLTQEDNSFIAQRILPAVPDLGEGYYIEVVYDSGLSVFYTTDGENRVKLTVREGPVEADVLFYSVTYHPNSKEYLGSVPKGGTYPKNYFITIAGNPGLLRNLESGKGTILTGWKDVYAGADNDPIYGSGELFQVVRRTDLFAQWVSSIRVYYKADDATGGEIPVDPKQYGDGEPVTVKAGTPERPGFTFAGWQNDQDHQVYQAGEQFAIGTADVTLTATWTPNEYTLTYWEFVDDEWTPVGGVVEHLHYGDTPLAAGTEILSREDGFLGWAESEGGEVKYQPGDPVTVTGEMNLYARFSGDQIVVRYHSEDGSTPYCEQTFGRGVSAYLTPTAPAPNVVTAWSTEPEGKGRLFLCVDNSNRSVDPVAFASDTDLYAVTGRVYNYNKQTWFNTLEEAAKKGNADAGNTLIVYRDTEEKYNIWFGNGGHQNNLYVLANGNRTVKWRSDATADGNPLYTTTGGEFAGCMGLGQSYTLTLGKSDISTLTMEGNSLTFDANKQSRVISVENAATLNMYDGVTMINGFRPKGESQDWWNSTHIKGGGNTKNRFYMGGGVYVGAGGTFNMYGGKVTHCEAFSGGGVYLYEGSKMQFGNMEHPTYYSSTAIYYKLDEHNEYVNVTAEDQVGPENYKNFFVTTGNPEISYNNSTRGGDVTDFSRSDGGGGLLMLDLKDGDLILYRGSIINNKANANGGGIVTDGQLNESKLRIYEVDISHNESELHGGGIFQWQGVLYVYNSTIRQNEAQFDGGGVYLHHYEGSPIEYSDIDFYYGDISGNRAKRNGGGVYVEKNQDMTIHEGNLYGNTADGKGGGAYLQSDNAHLYLQAGSIRDNWNNQEENDAYLAGNSVIEVMEGGLRFTQTVEERIQLDCDNAADGRVAVQYNQVSKDADFKAADVDYFTYNPAGTAEPTLFVAPNEADKTLILCENPEGARNVTFHANYQNADGNEETYSESAAVADSIPYHEFVREGYDLIGWATTPDANIEDYLVYRINGVWYTKYENNQWTIPLAPDENPQYTVTSDYNQQLYAMWRPYTVTYHLNTTNQSVVISQEESIGPTVTILEPTPFFEENGITYTFQGWSLAEDSKDVAYEAGDTVTLTESIHLYAVWQPDKITVTYDFTGGTDHEQYLTRQELVLRDKDLTIPVWQITKPDKILKGWALTQNPMETDTIYKSGETIPAEKVQEDFTLYAIWADPVTITFEYGYDDAPKPVKKTVATNDTFVIDLEDPVREGFIFAGWSDGTGNYKYNDTIGPVNADITLKALWIEEPIPVEPGGKIPAEEPAAPIQEAPPESPQATDETAQE